jgi:chromate transporter
VASPARVPSEGGTFLEVLAVFTRLGLTSFGGPVAHLGYFRTECVERRGWLDDRAYADLVALCQFLPGPASSQVGIGLGYRRAGLPGAVAAWLGFTLPSAIALAAFALTVQAVGDVEGAAWLRGLKLVAVAVVAHAVWGMATKLTPDAPRITVALAAAMVALVWTGTLAQVAIIAGGALLGLTWLPRPAEEPGARRSAAAAVPGGVGQRAGAALLAVFVALLVALPVVREATAAQAVGVADAFYRTGALVFGGGHVVLPLLQAEVVPAGWVDEATFIAGYGAAQAVPGPLFTFSAFLGASMALGAAGVGYAALAVVAVFVPSFLLLLGVLPYWDGLRRRRAVRRALVGVNAAVVGLLLAALYHPVWTAAVAGPRDVALVLAAYGALAIWKAPPWAVVVLGAAATAGLAAAGL